MSIIALFQVFLQTSDLGLELINFLYMVSFKTINKRTSASRNFDDVDMFTLSGMYCMSNSCMIMAYCDSSYFISS